MNTKMINVGLTERFIQESTLYTGMKLGRVSSQHKDLYKVITEHGEVFAEVSGKFRYEARSLADYPAVGDFVMLAQSEREEQSLQAGDRAIIHHVLTRKSAFERKAAGTSNDIQVVAANMDIVFICMALNHDFNLRRLERYLSIAWDSGATPVVVLTKADLCEDVQEKLNEVYTAAIGVDVVTTSGLSEDGFIAIQHYMAVGKTFVFIGSSGVGKSTLINRLLGETIMDTKETRNDDKGRHTTTHRELFVLPGGGVIIDTPGMRELGIESADLSKAFVDIDEFASRCKFSDCSHQTEPHCAVQQAILEGKLAAERLASYLKLKKEAKYEGLNSRQIETEKLNTIFAGIGGMKNARKFMKDKQSKRKR
ncbi:putative ribosome biogenesis GTPase RsgA 2 [Paenibacillus montaniterrae]|uniref:Small ribosomal subunit biogenesis GTPase RsgA n=1 Tax=Paenibacillus montaniterrae TaxID=429341 RepID=A0A920D053_9BACL|nr:ribosome small subunit-dependent GTPase A [Paenibacillus montaniterrae]GIP19431.1 putative ribosome biogenesis GTPase RsgA 2 [Paenibacillus montaniterrae]